MFESRVVEPVENSCENRGEHKGCSEVLPEDIFPRGGRTGDQSGYSQFIGSSASPTRASHRAAACPKAHVSCLLSGFSTLSRCL